MKYSIIIIALVIGITVLQSFFYDLRFAGRLLGELIAVSTFAFLAGAGPYWFFRNRVKWARVIVLWLGFALVYSTLLLGWESRLTKAAIYALFMFYPAVVIERWRESKLQAKLKDHNIQPHV